MVKVPATIIKSDCLGVGLKIIPNLSKSYLLTVVCIISTAQQARPKVKGHKEPFLTQEIRTFSLPNIYKLEEDSTLLILLKPYFCFITKVFI